MKYISYIKYLEALVVSFLDERNDNILEIVSTDTTYPLTTNTVFNVDLIRELISKQREQRKDENLKTARLSCFWRDDDYNLFESIFDCVYDSKKKAVIEVDQEYLDIGREVEEEYITINKTKEVIGEDDFTWAIEGLD